MPLPAFTENGDLPAGLYRATLAEMLDRFGVGPWQRRRVALRLERIYRLALGTNHLARFIVFGSFVTDKPEPNDIDIFLLMEDSFNVAQVPVETRLLFENATAQTYYGASVFWLRQGAVLGDEEALIGQWQVKRDGSRRRILEVIPG